MVKNLKIFKLKKNMTNKNYFLHAYLYIYNIIANFYYNILGTI